MPLAEVNGTRLWFEDRGTGPALVLLHGFTLDSRMWSRQIAALADQYRVIAYDSRGFGRSAMPEVGTRYRHCDDAAALCDHLGLTRVITVGHSIGAHHLLELAVVRPDLVAGSVSICPSGLASVPFPAEIQATFAAIRAEIAAAGPEAGVIGAKLAWSRCAWFSSVNAVPELRDEIDAMLADHTGWQWTHDNPVFNIDPPLSGRLGEIAAPALVLTGDLDLPYNDAVAAYLGAHMPRATRARLGGVGHMPNMEDPVAVNHAIRDFAAHVHSAST